MTKRLDKYRVFYSILAISLFITITLTTLFILIFRNNAIKEIRESSILELESQKRLILNHFDAIQSDLLFLPKLNELISFKELHKEEDLKLLENEFLEFTRTQQIYDQVRYIDADGNEIVRINNNNGSPSIVPKDKLQNKKTRYYFIESLKNREGDIYVSPFDLNMENGKVDTPLKPMIRFSTQVFHDDGSQSGIIIFNYLGQIILDDLRLASNSNTTNFSLMNRDGYWLYHKDESMRWGFHFSERERLTLKSLDPELWNNITNKETCHIMDNNILLCSTWLEPFKEDNIIQSEKWLLTNSIDLYDVELNWSTILHNIRYLLISLLGINIILSIILTTIILQKRRLKIKLQHSALYDPLTDLPNRRLLNDRLENTLEQAKRYGYNFAIIFIDLDGFKNINDTYGHDAGDQLLKLCSERLLNSVRSSDTVARIGGDEFVIILSKVTNRQDCEVVAGKILQELTREFELEYDDVYIGGSLGIVLTSGENNTLTREDLLSRADSAMYIVKEGGKNNYYIEEL